MLVQSSCFLSSRFRAEILRFTEKYLLMQIIAENFRSFSNSQEIVSC